MSAAAGVHTLGADLYGVLAAEAGNGDLVFSPSSIVTALAKAFDDGSADLSGMTAEKSLFISAVVHEAFISVGEEGTEATLFLRRVTDPTT